MAEATKGDVFLEKRARSGADKCLNAREFAKSKRITGDVKLMEVGERERKKAKREGGEKNGRRPGNEARVEEGEVRVECFEVMSTG